MYAISKMRSLLSTPTSLPRFSQLCTTHFPVQTQMIRRPHACPNTLFFPSQSTSKAYSVQSTSKAYSVQSSGETQHVRPVDDGIGDLIGFGEIHVIIGPMFAGKTTALLHRVQTERGRGRNVVMIKSNKDNRYGLDSVVTHDGAKMPCWALSDLTSFRAKIGAEAYNKLDVIGIDEAQFFEDLYDFCRHAADHDGKAVIVAGLDGDYLRRSFGSVIDVIPLADSVTKLTAQCEVCGKCAFFTLRKTEQTKTEVIGGADVYMPVCRQHYVNGQVVIKAARDVLETKKGQCDSYLEVGSLPS